MTTYSGITITLVRRSIVARAPTRTVEGVLSILFLHIATSTRAFSAVPMMERSSRAVVKAYVDGPVRSHRGCTVVFVVLGGVCHGVVVEVEGRLPLDCIFIYCLFVLFLRAIYFI